LREQPIDVPRPDIHVVPVSPLETAANQARQASYARHRGVTPAFLGKDEEGT
jgi:hypothetical protein